MSSNRRAPLRPARPATVPSRDRSPVGPRAARLRRFGGDRSGATAIEYGLIVGLIFLAITGSLRLYANSTNNMYNTISTKLGNAIN